TYETSNHNDHSAAMIDILTDWKHISFAHPFFFGLFIFIPVLIWWQFKASKKNNPALRLTSLAGIKNIKPGWRVRMIPILFVLRLLSLSALIVALARPQSSNVTENIDSEGIDIVMSVDV